MKLIILLLTIAACQAALLPSKSYLPQAPSGSFQTTFTTINSGSSAGEGNRRPQQGMEKNAAIVKLDQDVSETSFHYDYKTSNGISAHETGDASGSQGSFSYIGDDGITYTINFIANDGGFQAAGAHLPVAPPTPEAILLALQQNAKDEAAGIFDDGKYRPDKNSGGSHIGGHGSAGSFSSSSSQTSFNSGSIQAYNPNTGYQY